MDWSLRRKIKIVALVSSSILLIFFLIFWKSLFPSPNCFDGRKNGDESGRDCGGGCALYCEETQRPIRVVTARSFPIAQGVIHSVAFLEQFNRESAIRSISYEFVYFDEAGVEIGRRAGSSPIGAFGPFVIMETLVEVPQLPAYTTFSFTGAPVWEKIPPEIAYPLIRVKDQLATSFPLGTRVTATIENKTDYTFSDTPVYVLVYGNEGNVQAVSSVKIESLPQRNSISLTATWPFRFREPVSKIEIFPSVNPFTASSL